MGTAGIARLRWLLGLTVAGVAGSHLAAYRLAAPNAHELTHVLETTGHGYLSGFVTFSLFALALTLVGFAAERFLKAPSNEVGASRFSSTIVRMFLLQAAAFLIMEISERALAGNGFSLAGSPVVYALLIQFVIACLGTLVLLLIGRTIDALKSGGEAAPSEASSRPEGFSFGIASFRPLLLAGGSGLRGPPLG